jgi:hypothetical protein
LIGFGLDVAILIEQSVSGCLVTLIMSLRDSNSSMVCRVQLIVDLRDGAIERLLATMYRKRVRYDMLHVWRESSVWNVEIDAELPAQNFSHLLAAIEREPSVIEVKIIPVEANERGKPSE